MEVQIQELIDRIKAQGVAKAEESAAAIAAEAEKKAADIIADAKKQAQAITAAARSEANKFHATGKQAVIQAGRDLILNIRASIGRIFNALIEREVKAALDSGFLKTALVQLLTAWVEKEAEGIEVLLPEKDYQALQDFFLEKLEKQLKMGVEIKPSPHVTTGFQVVEKEGSAFYDLTDQGIADALKPGLNARLAECIEAALGQE